MIEVSSEQSRSQFICVRSAAAAADALLCVTIYIFLVPITCTLWPLSQHIYYLGLTHYIYTLRFCATYE